MGINPEDFKKLIAPFLAKEHEFNPRGFIYIEETALCQRIEQVDLSWEWRVESVNRYDPKGMIATTIGHLTICGITRSGEGSQMVEFRKGTDIESGEVEKGSETDALKRAARKFGIGRYLLECPKDVKEYGPALNKWLGEIARQQGAPTPPSNSERAPAPQPTQAAKKLDNSANPILSSTDPVKWPAFLKWANDKFAYSEQNVRYALYPLEKDGLIEWDRDALMARVLAAASGYSAERITANAVQHKITETVEKLALTVEMPIPF